MDASTHPEAFTYALLEALTFETYRVHLEVVAQLVVDAETGLAEAATWLEARQHPRASPSYPHRRRRRAAAARAARVRLARAHRAWVLHKLFAELADATEESARRYVRELAAAREALTEVESPRSHPDM